MAWLRINFRVCQLPKQIDNLMRTNPLTNGESVSLTLTVLTHSSFACYWLYYTHTQTHTPRSAVKSSKIDDMKSKLFSCHRDCSRLYTVAHHNNNYISFNSFVSFQFVSFLTGILVNYWVSLLYWHCLSPFCWLSDKIVFISVSHRDILHTYDNDDADDDDETDWDDPMRISRLIKEYGAVYHYK